jgi:hypothetical protein
MDSNIDMLREAVKRALQFPANWAPALLEGTVTSIKDPLELGRAKVLLDHFTGPDGTGFETDWLYPLELKLWGILPKNLIGQKVLCHTVNHSYEDMRVSLGVKPLIYQAADPLPLAVVQNLGLVVLRQIAQESYLCVMTKRNGQITLEALSPLYHLHANGDTLTQGNDSGGNFQSPIQAKPTGDSVYVTSVTPYLRDSGALPPPIQI